MRFLIQHIPHVIPVVIVWGILIRFWLAQRRLEREPGAVPAQGSARPPVLAGPPRAAAPIRRSIAVRGLVALGPLIAALATGIVIYALNLGTRHSEAAIWIHVGISLLALLLVVYKVAGIGWARLRESVSRARLRRSGASVVLLVLWIPLLITGVALVIWPSAASFTAYMHLVASVWWTGLLLWHLRRYLARAVGTALGRSDPVVARLPSGAAPQPGPSGRRPARGGPARARPVSGRRAGSPPVHAGARREAEATAAAESVTESALGG